MLDLFIYNIYNLQMQTGERKRVCMGVCRFFNQVNSKNRFKSFYKQQATINTSLGRHKGLTQPWTLSNQHKNIFLFCERKLDGHRPQASPQRQPLAAAMVTLQPHIYIRIDNNP